MANITRTEAAPFVPILVAQQALGYLVSNLVAGRTTQNYSQFSPNQFASFGETLVLPKVGAVVINDKTENSNFQKQSPTATSVSLSLNKHKEATVSIERRAATVSNQGVLDEYLKVAMLKMAEQVEIDVIAAIVAASTIPIGTSVAMTEANIIAAKQGLTAAKSPQGMKRYGIISPTQVGNLFQIDRLVTWLANGQKNNIANGSLGSGNADATYNAYLGRLYDFEMYESTNVPFPASVSKNMFYSADALIFASKPLKPVAAGQGVQTAYAEDPESGMSLSLTHWYDPLAGAYVFSLESIYGVVASRPEHIAVVSAN
jgi:hypothetical protein